MGHHSVIWIFGIISFMGWYMCTFSTKKIIKEVGFHKKYYPKRYIMPSRKMRTLSYLLSDNKPFVAQLFIWIYGIFMCADILHVLVCLCLYR